VSRIFSIRPSITFRGRRFFGLRGWSGKPTHPPLTDFPVVCYVLAAGCDVVSFVAARGDAEGVPNDVAHDFFVTATIVLVAGAVVSLGTALTGFMDWWKGMPRDRSAGVIGKAKRTQVWRTANWHMTVMLTVTAIVIVDLLLRWAQFDEQQAGVAVVILSVLAGLLVAFGATYGGSLVFDYGFNVQDVPAAWEESEVDHLPGPKGSAS
jgi:uncharacterized membrane protein